MSSVDLSDNMRLTTVCHSICLLVIVVALCQATPLPDGAATECSVRYESCGENRGCCSGFKCVDPTAIREDVRNAKVALNGGVMEADDAEYELYTGSYSNDYEELPTDPTLTGEEGFDEAVPNCSGEDCPADDYVIEPDNGGQGICMPIKETA